ADLLAYPKYFDGPRAEQEDAVRVALKAFGIDYEQPANTLELARDSETALSRLAVMEDGAIEHDARTIPGFLLADSEVTGRAIFVKGTEAVEVFTTNRRPLEHVFGVDLIYHNLRNRNLLMLQYKMLEKASDRAGGVDWIYRPDRQLDAELRRMK